MHNINAKYSTYHIHGTLGCNSVLLLLLWFWVPDRTSFSIDYSVRFRLRHYVAKADWRSGSARHPVSSAD